MVFRVVLVSKVGVWKVMSSKVGWWVRPEDFLVDWLQWIKLCNVCEWLSSERVECCALSLSFKQQLYHPWLISVLTLLLRHITGQREQPQVHKQKQQPQRSHRADTGRVFLRTVFTRPTEPVNSSGANRPVNALGKSRQKRLLRPNLSLKKQQLVR